MPTTNINAHGGVFLCYAWGESDWPVTAIVPDWDGVRTFIINQWLGDEDSTDFDGTPTLPRLKEEFDAPEWDLVDSLEWKFEIGGVRITKVFDVGAGPEPMDMALCEIHRVVIRPGQPYTFTRIGDCKQCAEMEREAVNAYEPLGFTPVDQPAARHMLPATPPAKRATASLAEMGVPEGACLPDGLNSLPPVRVACITLNGSTLIVPADELQQHMNDHCDDGDPTTVYTVAFKDMPRAQYAKLGDFDGF